MIPYWETQFTPYIRNVEIGEVSFQFCYGTPLSRSWYDPIKPYVLTEYLWIQRNLNLGDTHIVDAGAHHGHYSCYFASLGGKVIAVEPLLSNIDLIRINSAINQFDIDVVQAAISQNSGYSTFIPRSNGKLFPGIGINVPLKTLPDISPHAKVVKLDIEGAEFQILPLVIDQMPEVNAWIIEAHSTSGNVSSLAKEFTGRRFDVKYLDRNSNRIEPFNVSTSINYTTTIFCIK
jgi:FkbM family methyltransferase